MSAHLDHLGVGAPINGKTIYSGAMDDASGVATVLETAKKLSQAKTRPKRSMLFVIFTAEEKGLLGSRYFAGHPTVPESAIDADLNLDMFMPLFALKKLHVQGLDESTLGDGREEGGGRAWDCDCAGSGAGPELVYPHGPIQLCAGGSAGAGDEVWMDGGFAGVQGVAGRGWRSGITRPMMI